MDAPAVPPNRDAIVQWLRDHWIIPTQQRIDIASVLLARPRHLTAERLLDEINTAHNGAVSKATVYNTLNLFVDKGLIREVIVEAGRVFYDANTAPHHHVYNLDTGEITDFPADGVRILGLPNFPKGVEVAGVDIVVRVREHPEVVL